MNKARRDTLEQTTIKPGSVFLSLSGSLNNPSFHLSLDLADLMAKYSDLSANSTTVNKNFTFLQPKTQLFPAAKSNAFYSDSQSAVDWKSTSSDFTFAFSTTACVEGW